MKKPTQTAIETEAILKEDSASRMTGVSPRDSDNELIIQILQRFRNANFTPEQMNIIRGVSFESVTRYRRGFQSLGMYAASPLVRQKRHQKEQEIQQNAPNEPLTNTQRRVQSYV